MTRKSARIIFAVVFVIFIVVIFTINTIINNYGDGIPPAVKAKAAVSGPVAVSVQKKEPAPSKEEPVVEQEPPLDASKPLVN